MFSAVQDPNLLSIQDQAKHLGEAFRSLNDAYCALSQTYGLWNQEINEYLHEELYSGVNAQTFMGDAVELLHEINNGLYQLAVDHRNLVSDLERVGRGDSFSV